MMPDFKGRKDFPEVADTKIKIGDYSGTNRLAVTDIYSPKAEPTLRDQMIEPVKGNKQNNYDSPILSQQPVIVLSDMEAEAALINAIDGYVAKQTVQKLGPGGPVPQNPLKPAGGGAGGHDAAPEKPKPWTGNPGAWRQDEPKSQGASPTSPSTSTSSSSPFNVAPSGGRPPLVPNRRLNPQTSSPTAGGGAASQKPLGDPTRLPPSYSPHQQRRSGGGGYTAEQQRNAMNPRNTVTIPQIRRQPEGGAGAPEDTTPGGGGQGAGGRARGLIGRGLKHLGRGIKDQASAVGQAAKVGVQQGIRHGVEGAKEQGPEAEARRAEQREKVYRNPLTATVASGALRQSRLGGVKQVARGMGYGKNPEEAKKFATRHEYADADDLSKEMMLSDILNELESYIEQPTNDVAERQLTKGNFSKMMRNTDDKPAQGWKYHV